MSDGSPWIVCRASFTDEAVRDALRNGLVASRVAEWIVQPEHELWGRAVDLLVEVHDGPEQTLLIGPGASVSMSDADASSAISEDDPVGEDEIETWPAPAIVVVRTADPDGLHEWPRDRGELIDAAEVVETSLWSQIKDLSPWLVERSEAWLSDTPARVARQTAHLERMVDDLLPHVGVKSKLALVRARNHSKAALRRLGDAAMVAAGVEHPPSSGTGAAPSRIRVGGLDTLIELDDAANKALAGLLDVVAAGRVDAEARNRAAASLEEASVWVQEHGSERLRKALELDALDLALGAYRDERLSHVGPLWLWLPGGDNDLLRNPVNPSENALDLLAAARQDVDPKARIRFHTKAKVAIVVASLLDRKIWRPAMDWVEPDDIVKVIRRRGRAVGPSEFIADSMDEEPF